VYAGPLNRALNTGRPYTKYSALYSVQENLVAYVADIRYLKHPRYQNSDTYPISLVSQILGILDTWHV